MKLSGYHRLHLFVLGLAYALGRISRIVPGATPDMRAHIFSLQHENEAAGHLSAVMALASTIDVRDPVLQQTVSQYNASPLLERCVCWEQIKDSFSSYSGIIEGDSFSSSVLTDKALSPARTVYEEHQAFFDRLVLIIQRQASNGISAGIIFFVRE